jgi:UDP-N-acetylmuramoyl-tripeptide--D-alanyl-D-alanine ligase
VSLAFSAADAVRWTGGRLAGGAADARFDAVSIDTRSLSRGAFFVAIRGENHDAHGFLAAALDAGAAGLLVERGRAAPAEAARARAVVEVNDTTRALGALAAGHRAGFAGPLVGVTGSNGKTTSKEMCAAILDVCGPCLRTRGNLNNQFGLPLTLLEREAEHRFAVIEMGTNHPGEIAALAALARPTIGLITNVGSAHVEFLGSREGVAREKGALFEALPPDGVAVVNADDAQVREQAPRTRARVLLFGAAPDAEVRAVSVRALGARGFAFGLVAPAGRIEVEVAGIGDTTVQNALAAAAAALAAGADLAAVRRGLARWTPVHGRMEPRTLAGGVHLIDDSYNANPQSVDAALRSLARLRGAGRAFAVLGSMGELGSAAEDAHRDAGALAAELGIDWLVAVGEHADQIAAGARAGGMDPARICAAESHAEASRHLRGLLAAEDWVLVKGSRSSRMERVIEALAGGSA